MKINKFKKTGKDKYKLYLDNGDVLSLYEDVIINNDLLLKKEVNEDLIDDLIKQNNDVHVYGNAINYISIRMRSKKEVFEYLKKKGSQEQIINDTIDRLIKEGYINDFNFAKAYVNDQMILSNSGPNKIKNNLINLGISKDIIEEVIEDIDQTILSEKLSNLMEKQIRIKRGSVTMLRLKLINYFYNLGYDKELILEELSKFNMKTDITHLKKEYDKLYNKYQKKYSGNELDIYIINKLYAKGYSKEDINKIKES